ncbi:alpha/beta hydrolase [Saccharibacillus sp. O16]|nr:alpha/beta hydrolase [Saccharibacillus sp. O16]
MESEERAKRRAAMDQLVAQADAGLPTETEPTEPKKSPKGKKSGFRRFLSAVGWILIALLLLLVVGFIYQWWGERQDRAAFVAPGDRVEVDGRRMHVYHEELPGKAANDPTVVFIAGWGTPNPYANFSPVYERLRGKANFAVIERFGYGYSDETDKDRDIDTLTRELREGLAQAGVQPPYILAPHSLGVLEAIRFSQLHPEDVAGLLMIDTGSPEFYETFPSEALQSQLQRVAIKSGIVRALYHVDGFAERIAAGRNGLKLLSPEMKEQDRLATLLVANNHNVTDEMREMHANARKVVAEKTRLNIPMVILVADHLGEISEDRMDVQRQFGDSWSNDAEEIVVQDSGHSMQAYQPQAIADAAIRLVEKVR